MNTYYPSAENRARMIAYSVGGLGFALCYQCFNTYAEFFYIDVLKVPASWIGVAMAVYGIWNAINDPLAGQISDHTRSRWGRRLPYLIFGSAPLVLCFILVWTPPHTPGPEQTLWLIAYFFLVIIIFDALYTFVALNWTALFPEMYPTLRQRARVSGWRNFFAIPGLILGIALAPMIYGTLGWAWMGVIFGIVTAVALFISRWGSWERAEFRREQPMGFREAVRATMSSRAFRLFMVVNFGIQFVFVMLPATIPFYVKYVLALGDVETSAVWAATFLTAVPFLYVWTKVTERFGCRRSLMGALIIFSLALLPLLVVNSFAQAVIVFTCIGIGFAGLLMLPDILIADVIDDDELRTGVRREGMYFGFNGFIIRFAITVQSLILTQALVRSGYRADITNQPEPVLQGLRLLMTVVPVIALAVSLFATKVYPLDGDKLVHVKAQVALLHEAKEAGGEAA